MSLLDRISSFKYDGEPEKQEKESSKEDEVDEDDRFDAASLTAMLENIIRRCHDPKSGDTETDILIESERWIPNLGMEQRQEWSPKHLSGLDWKMFEPTPVVKAPNLAEFHCKHGIIWSSEGLTSPLPNEVVWRWDEEAWRLSADDYDQLVSSCGWWYGAAFPNNKTVECVKKMNRRSHGGTFVRCRLWFRSRERKTLKDILKLIIAENKKLERMKAGDRKGEITTMKLPSLEAALTGLLKVRKRIRRSSTDSDRLSVSRSRGESEDYRGRNSLSRPRGNDTAFLLDKAASGRNDDSIRYVNASNSSKSSGRGLTAIDEDNDSVVVEVVKVGANDTDANTAAEDNESTTSATDNLATEDTESTTGASNDTDANTAAEDTESTTGATDNLATEDTESTTGASNDTDANTTAEGTEATTGASNDTDANSAAEDTEATTGASNDTDANTAAEDTEATTGASNDTDANSAAENAEATTGASDDTDANSAVEDTKAATSASNDTDITTAEDTEATTSASNDTDITTAEDTEATTGASDDTDDERSPSNVLLTAVGGSGNYERISLSMNRGRVVFACPGNVPDYVVDAEEWIAESLMIEEELKKAKLTNTSGAVVPPIGNVEKPLSMKAWDMFGATLTSKLAGWDMEAEISRASETIRRMTGGRSDNAEASPMKRELRIPHRLLRNAKGVALVSTAKVGFMFGGRVGCGIVLARTRFGWSAPSSILLLGLGGGLQIGAEVGRLLLVLNTDAAVRAFCGGQITLGADVGVALGPVGRHAGASVSSGALEKRLAKKRDSIRKSMDSIASRRYSSSQEGDNEQEQDIHKKSIEKEEMGVELNSLSNKPSSISSMDDVDIVRLAEAYDKEDEELEDVQPNAAAEVNEFEEVLGGTGTGAAIYAYAYQRGLFVSMLSLEGTIIVPRVDVNNKFYGKVASSETMPKPSPSDLLNGLVPPPKEARELYDALSDAFETTPEVIALSNALSVE